MDLEYYWQLKNKFSIAESACAHFVHSAFGLMSAEFFHLPHLVPWWGSRGLRSEIGNIDARAVAGSAANVERISRSVFCFLMLGRSLPMALKDDSFFSGGFS